MTRLTRGHKMDRIARALFEHGTSQKAAAALAMSEVTVWRWKQKPEFPEAYREVQREALSRSSGRLMQGASAAVTTMFKVMADPSAPAGVRVRAAEAVLVHAEKTFELEDSELRRKRERTKPEHSGPGGKPIPVIVLPALQGPTEEHIMAVPQVKK